MSVIELQMLFFGHLSWRIRLSDSIFIMFSLCKCHQRQLCIWLNYNTYIWNHDEWNSQPSPPGFINSSSGCHRTYKQYKTSLKPKTCQKIKHPTSNWRWNDVVRDSYIAFGLNDKIYILFYFLVFGIPTDRILCPSFRILRNIWFFLVESKIRFDHQTNSIKIWLAPRTEAHPFPSNDLMERPIN